VEGRPDRHHRQYLHVAVSGRWHHDKERYLYAPAASGLGWHVFTPLEMAPARFVWINRGFVPDARKDPATRPDGQTAGEAGVAGLIRVAPARTLFTPDNDVARNLWYWPDTAAMTASAFAGSPVGVLPFFIDADALPEPPGGLPKGGVTRLELPNRHLEYAITWYGLALTLIGVYSAFAASRLRLLPGTR
jgi:surfeit locus 1 family protein